MNLNDTCYKVDEYSFVETTEVGSFPALKSNSNRQPQGFIFQSEPLTLMPDNLVIINFSAQKNIEPFFSISNGAKNQITC